MQMGNSKRVQVSNDTMRLYELPNTMNFNQFLKLIPNKMKFFAMIICVQMLHKNEYGNRHISWIDSCKFAMCFIRNSQFKAKYFILFGNICFMVKNVSDDACFLR